MASLFIFGSGHFAEVACFYFSVVARHRVEAFVVDDEYSSENTMGGKPILSQTDFLSERDSLPEAFFVAIGYSQLNSVRRRKLDFLEALGLRPMSYLSEKALIAPKVEIGPHAFILEQNNLQPYVHLGGNVVLWSGNHVGHHSRIGDDAFISSHCVIGGNTVIGHSAFLGVNSSVADGVVVGDCSVVGMGAQVSQNVEPGSLLVSSKEVKVIAGGAKWF